MTYRYPSYLKAVNFANNKANLVLKSTLIHLHVDYPNGFDNDMDIHSKDDLIWGLRVFVKEYQKNFV